MLQRTQIPANRIRAAMSIHHTSPPVDHRQRVTARPIQRQAERLPRFD